jgi:hypothetical protein
MTEPSAQPRKWTRLEYDRLVEAELLGPEDRIELLGGHMIVKEPPYSPHATGICLVRQVLIAAFGAGWIAMGARSLSDPTSVSCHSPLRRPRFSSPISCPSPPATVGATVRMS